MTDHPAFEKLMELSQGPHHRIALYEWWQDWIIKLTSRYEVTDEWHSHTNDSDSYKKHLEERTLVDLGRALKPFATTVKFIDDLRPVTKTDTAVLVVRKKKE